MGPMNPDIDEEQKRQLQAMNPSSTATETPPPGMPGDGDPLAPVQRALEAKGITPSETTTKTTTIEQGFKPSAGVLGEQERAYKAEEEATKSLAKAQEDILSETAKLQEQKEVALTKEQEKLYGMQDTYKKELGAELTKYDDAYKELAEANKIEINPKRYIDNMSTAAKVFAGIGVLLSGLGGPEAAAKSLSLINKAVDDDIAAQKVSREGKVEAAKTGIASIDKKVKGVQDRLNDDMVFNNIQKDLRLSAVESQIQSALTKAKVPEVQAKLQQGLAAIQQQRADNKIKLEEMARNKAKTVTEVKTEPRAKDVAGISSLRKEFKDDQVVKDATDTYMLTQRAKEQMKLAEAGDPAAVGMVSTLVAGAVQKGTLSEKDIARGSGVPPEIIKKGADAIDQYIAGKPPAEQMKTLQNMLNVSEAGAKKRHNERAQYYGGVAERYGVPKQDVIVPLEMGAPSTSGGGYPKTVSDGKRTATVNNAAEEAEASKEGFK
jgi:hypothetical protein